MTEKLYDTDPYGRRFTARVVSCRPVGDGYETELDATLFFPEEGGQCADTGTLDGQPVTAVRLDKDGTILHTTSRPLTGEVEGVLDWEGRFRRMQHHTGEHILSGLFYAAFGYENVGFHLGENEVTLDVGGPLTSEQIEQIEQRANQVIWEDHPVTTGYPDEETLRGLSFRSKRASYDHTRIVCIEGVDTCACCAPHVSGTGQIGCIKVVSFAKNKNATRLWIVCGADAFSYFRTLWEQSTAVSRLLKVPTGQIGDGVEKLLTQYKEQNFTVGLLKRGLLERAIDEIPFQNGSLCLVCDSGENEDMTFLLNRAKEKAREPVAVLWGNDEQGYRFQLYGSPQEEAKHTALIASLGGKGGGKNGFFQGRMATTFAAVQQAFDRVICL